MQRLKADILIYLLPGSGARLAKLKEIGEEILADPDRL